MLAGLRRVCCGSREKDEEKLVDHKFSARTSSMFRRASNLSVSEESFADTIAKAMSQNKKAKKPAVTDHHDEPTLKGYRHSSLAVTENDVDLDSVESSSINSADRREIEEAREALAKQKKERKKEERKKENSMKPPDEQKIAIMQNSIATVEKSIDAPQTETSNVESSNLLSISPEASPREGALIDSHDHHEEEEPEECYSKVQERIQHFKTRLKEGGHYDKLWIQPVDDNDDGVEKCVVSHVKDRITKILLEEEQQNDNITQAERERIQKRVSRLQQTADTLSP